MKYKIHQQIETLANNAVDAASEQPNFTANGITFTHWDFNHRDGWVVDAWLAEAVIEADDYIRAFAKFGELLTPVIPRVAFVSQCYTEARMQPILIVKEGSTVGLFSDFFASEPVSLMFMEAQKTALDKLLADSSIDNSFFFYWNDATNTVGYTAKLLVMLAAIENLAKKPNGGKDWSIIHGILGKDLTDELYQPGNKGLRNRLSHGEYFGSQDSKNYVDTIHKKVMTYFNDKVLGAKLLSEDVVHPQRHFFGNKMHGARFISPKGEVPFDLKTVLGDANTSEDRRLDKFEWVTSDTLTKDY